MPKGAGKRRVVVAGDVTVDWNLARTGEQKASAYWASGRQTKVSCQPGGAALLGAVVRKTLAARFGNRIDVEAPSAPLSSHPGEDFSASFSLWSEHQKITGDEVRKKEKAWRVEKYLGVDPAVKGKPAMAALSGGCDLLILDDAGLGFRDREDVWMPALAGKPKHILLKMSVWQNESGEFRHVGEGRLFDELRKHPGRLTVVVNVNDLRLRDAAISRDLSWENTAEDLAQEFTLNPTFGPLAKSARVVVRLGASGVLLYSGPEELCNLYFDPAEIAASWEQRRPGGVIGYTVCLVAAVARHLLEEPGRQDWRTTFQRAVAAQRILHEGGYLNAGSGIRFPEAEVAEALQTEPPADQKQGWPGTELCMAPVPLSQRPTGPAANAWTILGARYPDALAVAEDVVRHGPKAALCQNAAGWKSAIMSVPMAEFKDHTTVDRQETENLRTIGALVQDYCARPADVPLSFAVFGPPGCGKSFAIEQLAASVVPGKTKKLTFNLSQFSSADELAVAFHQVRDAALRGETPLVFWDEFDASLGAKELGWLKYFLAPMQDGCFQAGPLIHPVGRAIFAFAGSVRDTMRDFETYAGSVDGAKGRDFISRLKGFVNILGPDPQPGTHSHYVLRRALILRSALKRERPLLFDAQEQLRIDAGVLRALLFVSKYEHGVRSLTSVIAMSVLEGRQKFERSCLPPAAQLDLHVNAAEFLAITNGVRFDSLDSATIERMAEVSHEAFYNYLKDEKYTYGLTNDTMARTHTCYKPTLAELEEKDQSENRRFVRDIPNRLILAGYVISVLRKGDPVLSIPADEVEGMAEREHERWMRSKLGDGFRYGARKAGIYHNCLLPWKSMTAPEREQRYGAWADLIGDSELPDSEKEKDRILTKAIPKVLASVGLKVTPIPRSRGTAQGGSPLAAHAAAGKP